MIELAKCFVYSMHILHTWIAVAPLWASLIARAIACRVSTANGLPGDGAELH